MDTQTLEAFLAVADTGSFSLAAGRLHLTQPAVSKRIATLESQLAARLFDRIGRRPQLTEAGRALLPRAQRILLDMLDARRTIDALGDTVAGRLKLGISHHLGLHRAPPLLAEYARRYPAVRLDIEFLDSEQAAERVLSGELELALGTLSPTPQEALKQQPVWHDELLVTVAPGHPLANCQRVDLRTLSAHAAIVPGLHSFTGKILQQLFAGAGLPLEVGMDTHYLETIKTMVAIGLGWSILPRTVIDCSVRTLVLHGPGNADPAPSGEADRTQRTQRTTANRYGKPIHLSRELGYQVHRNRSLSNAATAFIDALRSPAESAAD